MPSSYDSLLIYMSLKCVVLAFCTNWHFEERGSLEQTPPVGCTRARKAFSKKHTFQSFDLPGGALEHLPLYNVQHTTINTSFIQINDFTNYKSNASLF